MLDIGVRAKGPSTEENQAGGSVSRLASATQCEASLSNERSYYLKKRKKKY